VDGPPQQADPVSKARHFIVRHLAEPISIPEVAAASGLSHNQLLRRFRAATGCTLLAWLRRTRCERALDLLQHSDLSIAAIGAAVGYPDPQHFNKIMRTETNKPPRAWRQHFLASAQPP
jgi:transcriptional regulator GlxA family with amidase domain